MLCKVFRMRKHWKAFLDKGEQKQIARFDARIAKLDKQATSLRERRGSIQNRAAVRRLRYEQK